MAMRPYMPPQLGLPQPSMPQAPTQPVTPRYGMPMQPGMSPDIIQRRNQIAAALSGTGAPFMGRPGISPNLR